MTFAKWVFRLAGIYGIVVVAPMYFAAPAMNAAGQPMTHPEMLYGFVGVTLAFQLVFLIISGDPGRYRPLMLAAIVEKLSFPVAVWPLYLMGRTPGLVVVFASIDLILAVLFAISWMRTNSATS